MDDVKYISYADWISLISGVMKKGLSCNELEELKKACPHSMGEAYDVMVYNHLAKLEEYMLKEAVKSFQKQMAVCLGEMDLEIAEVAFSRFRKHYDNCMFFLRIQDYPESVKSKLSEEIRNNMNDFVDSFVKYLKKMECVDNSKFIQDYVYVCKKKLQKIKTMY